MQKKEILIENSKNLSWKERTFRKLEPGSQRGAVILVICTTLGTGIFTLHKVMYQSGILFGSILLSLVCIACYYSLNMMIFACKNEPKAISLPDLVNRVLGSYLKLLYSMSFLFFCIIASIGGILAFSKLFYFNLETQIWNFFDNVPEEKRNVHFFS